MTTVDLSQFDGMTQGPWRVDKFGGVDGGFHQYTNGRGPSQVASATIVHNSRAPDIEAERMANARAIASVPDLIAEVRELRAKLAAAEADARRYRALRDLPELCLGVHGIPCIAIPSDPNSGDYVTGQEADAAVDSAIAGGAP